MILGNKKRSRYIAGVAVSTALMPFSLQTSLADEVWLEEIVVTAQKRLETAQEVPIAISAFSEDTIKNIGAQNIRDLGRFTPGLEANNPSDTQPIYSIRGIQTQDVAIGTDPAVAVYIDGVYVGRSGGAQMNFNDIERVEILRGPQGTLFGRNAAAGAISIITKKPTALTEGNVMATIGNYNKLKLEGIYNTELTDGVYGRFGAVWNERDGFIDNDDPSGRGQDTLGQEGNWSLVGSVLWDTIDDTEIIWRMEYDKLDKDAPYAYSLNPALYHNKANAPKSFGDESGAYNDTYENDSPSFEKRTLWGSSLTVNHDFNDDLSFISITSFRSFDSDNREDEDGTAIIGRYFDTHNQEDNDSFSQEFRLSYHSDGAWSWSTGVSYFREKAEQQHNVIFGTQLVDLLLEDSLLDDGVVNDDKLTSDGSTMDTINGLLVNDPDYGPAGLGIPGADAASLIARQTLTDIMLNDLTFTSYAWYGDITYTFTDQWDLTLGLRYTNDSKDFKRTSPANGFGYRLAFDSYPGANGLEFLEAAGDWLLLGSPKPATPSEEHSDKQNDTWSKWTPRAVLNYRITPQMMTYLSASSGFKAGGYNGVGFTPDPFEQETVENYELGYKSTWLDSRLRFNVAAFYYEYNDLQILEFVKLPGTSFSQHYLGNGDARARGLETEVQWMVQDSLMLTFNSAYLDTEYVKYVKATSTGYRNLADEPMSTVPKETYNLGAEYTMTAGDLGDFIFRFDTSYIGDRVDNTGEQDKTIGSYTVTNARITYAHVSGDWEAALWADNLFDKDYLLGGTQSLAAGEANSPMVRRGTPRFWGVDYRHYF